MPRVAVVAGSSRPKRICPEIAEWVRTIAQQTNSLAFETIDLREIGLPFLDEPDTAARGIYVHEHTRAWSRLVLRRLRLRVPAMQLGLQGLHMRNAATNGNV